MEKDPVRERKRSGTTLLIVGIPNSMAGLLVFIASLALAVVMGVIVVSMWGDSTGDAIGDLCIVFLIIFFLIFLVVALIVVLLSGIFSLGLLALTISGYYAIKGRRYGRMMALAITGIVISSLTGIFSLMIGMIVLVGNDVWAGLAIMLFGIFEIACSILAILSVMGIRSTRSTFEPAPEN